MNIFRKIVRKTVPFSVRSIVARYRGRSPQCDPPPPPDWEAMPSWSVELDHEDAGWHAESVATTQFQKWNLFQESISGTGPLGVSHETTSQISRENTWAHNLIMTYGYVLGLASHQKQRVSILDWGGGMGHYYELTRALYPHLHLEYSCSDVSSLVNAGKQVLPDVHFFEVPDGGLENLYDLVMAGSSLWYAHDWRLYARKLASSSREWLYITRMMFVESSEEFPAVQRPWKFGYQTEYQCWILNRNRFIQEVCKNGMSLVREFVFGTGPEIVNAPEQAVFRGFLFRRNTVRSNLVMHSDSSGMEAGK